MSKDLLARTCAIIGGCAVAVLICGCAGRLFYFPTAETYRDPAAFGLEFQSVAFTTSDGVRLHGWFIPAVGTATGTVIHFHGNAQNMSAHFSYVYWLPAAGFNLFTFDYRGYGRSEGRPTRRGLHRDGLAALRYVRTRKDLDPDRLVLLGQSIGGAVAASVMGGEEVQGVKALIVDSSFYSYRSIVRDKIKRLGLLRFLRWPLSFLVIGNSYSPGPVIDDVAPVPVLVIHGEADSVVPFHHGEWLYERARPPKAFWPVEGGEHADALSRHAEPYRERLVEFMTAALSVHGPVAEAFRRGNVPLTDLPTTGPNPSRLTPPPAPAPLPRAAGDAGGPARRPRH